MSIIFEETEEFNNATFTNKGDGAGGKNANINGKDFEKTTDNKPRLLTREYKEITISKNKFGNYLYKKYENKEIIFIQQNGVKEYIKREYNIDIFRNADEAYIIKNNDGTLILKILEKKASTVA